MLKHVLYASAALALLAAPAFADATTSISVQGSVDSTCHIGTPVSATLDFGMLMDPATGKLRTPIFDQTTDIKGSWCNTASTISVIATPLVAQNYVGDPPAGFTKAVNYHVTISGWTNSMAIFSTTGDASGGNSSTVAGSQSTSDPKAESLFVDVMQLTTPGTDSRLVADTNYSGTITVTLVPTA
jgi:hypothetical protein